MAVAIGKVLEKIGAEWTIYNLGPILYLMGQTQIKMGSDICEGKYDLVVAETQCEAYFHHYLAKVCSDDGNVRTVHNCQTQSSTVCTFSNSKLEKVDWMPFSYKLHAMQLYNMDAFF